VQDLSLVRPLRSDPRAYRTKEEEAAWKERDPIPTFAARLVADGVATQAEVDAVKAKVEKEIATATDFALNSPLPPVDELELYVYAPSPWTSADVAHEKELREKVRSGAPGLKKTRYWEALRDAMREELQRDPRVFLMGEDSGATAGLRGRATSQGVRWSACATHPTPRPPSAARDRRGDVRDATRGRDYVCGLHPLARGSGRQPGREERYMFGGKTTVPMVHPHRGWGGARIAAHHSQSLESLWTHFPGIYVVKPSTPYDAKGLLKAANRGDNPVMFIEHKCTYGIKGWS
jgi:hypothetical protein